MPDNIGHTFSVHHHHQLESRASSSQISTSKDSLCLSTTLPKSTSQVILMATTWVSIMEQSIIHLTAVSWVIRLWFIGLETHLSVIDGDLKSLKQLAEDIDANKRKKKHTGTCEWLLQTPNYQTWFNMESQYSVLWIHGHGKLLEIACHIGSATQILMLLNVQWDAERQL